MTDFIYRFDNEASAPSGAAPCWRDGDVTYMPVRVVAAEAVWSDGDEPTLTSPEEVADGYWLVAAVDGDNPPLPGAVDWSNVPGRVTPTFAGRDFPAAGG